MRSIPDELLARIVRQRPHVGALALALETHPENAVALERQIADAYLLGHADASITAMEMWRLAACTINAPYARWITPEVAADRSGYHRDTIVRLALDGKLPALRRGPRQLYVDRDALEAYQRLDKHAGGRPRKEPAAGN